MVVYGQVLWACSESREFWVAADDMLHLFLIDLLSTKWKFINRLLKTAKPVTLCN